MGVSQGMEEEFVHKILRNLTLVGMIFLASMLSGCTIPKLTLNSEDLYSLPTLPRGLKQFVVTDKKGHSHQQHQDKGETLVQLTALTAGGTGSGHTKQLLRGFT